MVLLRGIAQDVAAIQYCASKIIRISCQRQEIVFDLTRMIQTASAATPESTKDDDEILHVSYYWMSDEWYYSSVWRRMSWQCNIVLLTLSGFHARDKDNMFDVTGTIQEASAATPESTKGDDEIIHV